MEVIRSDLVIIGAGPTGLGAVQRFFELQSDNYIGKHTKILIIDRESEAGGLSRTVTDENGFSWDMGVHVIGFSKFSAFLKMLTDTIPEWNVIKRVVKADITGIGSDGSETKYVPYPVQNSVHYFPPQIRDKCLAELENRRILKSNDPVNFGDFSQLYFGKTLQSTFIRPYNEKVWTIRLEDMNSNWVKGRVPKIDMASLRRKCKSPINVDEDEQDEPTFRYPAGCKGIGELWKRFADKYAQKNFLYNTEVIQIDTKEKKMVVRDLKTSKELQISFELMISTIPFIELNKLCGLFADLKLRHSTVILVGIGLHKPQSELGSKLCWAYYPRKEISFYRCTILSNFSNTLTPNPDKYWSVLCEIGRRPEDQREPKEESIQRVIKDLISVNIVDSDKQVYSTYYCVISYGYPIPTLDRDTNLHKYQNAYEDCQIYSRGRFGNWKYELSNTDYCFEIGRQVLEKLYLDVDEKLC